MAARAVQVFDAEHEPDRPEGRVGQLDVHAGLPEPARDLAHRPGPILDVHDDACEVHFRVSPR
jgi:hypothetical protein